MDGSKATTPAGLAMTQQLKVDLENCLSLVDETEKQFAFFRQFPEAADPELHVKDVGPIKLPLSAADAKRIITQCSRSPFGKGTETVVDTSVRNTWQLDANQFELKNPKWKTSVNKAVKAIIERFGIVHHQSTVKAEIYKALLYEKGAFFKPHSDSEKTPGMFGTMVICLPSQHSGGDIIVSHGGTTKTFKTSEFSQSDYSLSTWFSDVTHEITPVTSGYRLVLTYNLVQTNKNASVSSVSEHKIKKINSVLAGWKKLYADDTESCPGVMAYVLSHKYTERGLQAGLLKGSDQTQFQKLQQACLQNGFEMLLVNMERKIYGGCDDNPSDDNEDDQARGDDKDEEEYYDRYHNNVWRGGWGSGYASECRVKMFTTPAGKEFHKITELCDDDLFLSRLVELDGSLIGTGIPFEMDKVVQGEGVFDEPDDEDFSGFTGNEGVSNTLFYRYTALLILPKEYKLEYVVRCSQEGNVYMDDYIKRLDSINIGGGSKDDLVDLCQLVVRKDMVLNNSSHGRKARDLAWSILGRRYSSGLFPNHTLECVIMVGLRLHELDLVTAALAGFSSELSAHMLQLIGEAIHTLGLNKFRKILDAAISTFRSLGSTVVAANFIVDSYEHAAGSTPQDLKALRNWAQEQVEKAVESPRRIVKDDARAFVAIAQQYGGMLSKTLLPLVKGNISNTSFAVAFLNALFDHYPEPKLTAEVVAHVFRDVLVDLVSEFSTPPQVEQPNKRQKLDIDDRFSDDDSFRDDDSFSDGISSATKPSYGISGPQMLSEVLDAKEILRLIARAQTMNQGAEINQILETLQREAQTVDSYKLGTFYMPFLRGLLDFQKMQNIPLQSPNYAALYRTAIASYATRYVGQEPAPPPHWSREKRGCSDSCKDCVALDAFLLHPEKTTETFPMGGVRRTHINSRIRCGDGSLKLETRLRPPPQSIVVTKLTDYTDLMKAWRSRHLGASKGLKGLDQAAMKVILGREFTDLMQMKAIKIAKSKAPANTATITPSTPSTSKRPPPSSKKTPTTSKKMKLLMAP